MSATAQQLKLRLFIEGVEVPVIAATVQVAPNSPAVCSIQIPPMAEGTRFLPRSLVHLYFLDLYETQSPFVSNRGSSAVNQQNQQNPTVYTQSLVAAQASDGSNSLADIVTNQRYKLLFGGEMVGFTWTKNVRNRSLVLQCLDWSNYWDYAYQWNNTDLFGPGIKALFSGGSTNLFTDFLEDEGAAIIRIIQQPSAQYPKLKGLLGGIIHLLEVIGGSYYYGKQFAGENIFFSLAELRLHITQMITAFEGDPSASRLLNADGYDGLFGRTLGGLGQQVSFRQAINALMGIIFHETYAIPTPLYVPGTNGSVSGASRKPISSDPRYQPIVAAVEQVLSTIDDVSSSMTAAKSSSSTDVGDLRATLSKRFQFMEQTIKTQMTQLTDPQVQSLRGSLGAAAQSLGQARTKLARWTPGNTTTLTPITTLLSAAKGQLQRVEQFDILQSSSTKGTPARLNAQIFRPDVWFTAPPRCNVLFPEHYENLRYSRMFLQEPTRFLLKTNDEFFGEDELFDQFYYAPKSLTTKTQKRTLDAMLSNDLLDHELFTGILPVFEKMGELNIFGARSGTVAGKIPKIGLAQRSTNFLYFKHRFSAREMSIDGRFNPYVVPGFPGLVIDKWVDAQSLADRQALINKYGGVSTDINQLLGTHFLGNFTQVEHTVDQRTGRTTIAVSYPRQPEESVEFLGATKDDQTVMQRFGSNTLRTTDVAALNSPEILSIGPNYGQITQVTDVTEAYKAQSDGKGRQLPLYDGPRRAGTGDARIQVPVGIAQPASAYGLDVVRLVGGNPSTTVAFRAFRIGEEVPRYRQTVVDLPAEEYIRPGWYGDCWVPSKIGAVYQQFFQTGAITDPQQVTDPAGVSTGTQDQTLEDALATSALGNDWEDPRTQAPAIAALDANSSIQDAVAFLVQTYSYVKLGGLSSDDFISSYVWRPIASMLDIFGSNDLQLTPDGLSVLQGIEGLHSRAFGPYDDLFGLATPDVTNIVGIQRGSTAAQRADVRKRRQYLIKEYVAALQFSRAVLG